MEQVMRRGARPGKWAMAAVLLLLASCGKEPAAPPAPGGPDVRAQLRTMAEGGRNAVFIRAIRDAGQACQAVTHSAWQRDVAAESLWAVQCEGGTAWAVYVARSGGARVA